MPIPKDNPLYNDITGAQTTQHRTDGQLIETDENGMPLSAATATPREDTPAAQKSGGTGVTGNTGMPGTSGTAGGTAAAGATGRAGHQPYGQFNGSSYQELEEFLREQMKAVKPETEEERKKREKREKVNGIISGISDMGRALANLYFTSQYAPNAYQGETMSDKYQARLDKAKAQRDKDLDRYYNYALNLGKIREGDKGFNFKVEQARLQQENADRAFAEGQRQYNTTMEFRQAEADRAQANADRAQANADRAFAEGQRQFDVTSQQHQQSLNQQAARLRQERENNSQTFTLGIGHGSVTVPRAAINEHNIGAIYNSLPQQYRTAKGKPITGKDMMGNSVVTGYGNPSTEDMVVAIGAFLGDVSIQDDQKTATRNALVELGKRNGNGKGKGRGY